MFTRNRDGKVKQRTNVEKLPKRYSLRAEGNPSIPEFTCEQTYTVDTWQIIFADGTELVAQVGCAEPPSTGDGLHIEVEWQSETPEWANDLTDEQLIKLVALRGAYHPIFEEL